MRGSGDDADGGAGLAASLRPFETVANPNWWKASSPLDLIPRTADPSGEGAEMASYFGRCLLTQGPHAAKRLRDVWMPWQSELVRYVFGARSEDGSRRVRTVFLKIGKGNSKTTTSALLALSYAMWLGVKGWGARGLIAIMAPSVAGADLSFQHINAAINADPELKPIWQSHTGDRSLTHLGSGLMIQILPPRLNAAAGRRPLMTLYEESWLASMEVRGYPSVMDQLNKGGKGSWSHPTPYLQVHLTTAPTERAREPYASMLRYARAVRDGLIVDEGFLPVLFEWPTQHPQHWPMSSLGDPSRWWIAMPGAVPGGPLDINELRAEFNDAMRSGSAFQKRMVLSQRFGIEPDEDANQRERLQVLWPTIAQPDPTWPADDADIIAVGHDPAGLRDPHAMCCAWRSGDVLCLRVFQFLLRAAYEDAGDDLRMTYDRAIAADELELFDTPADMDAEILRFHKDLAQAGAAVLVGGDRHGRGGFVSMLEDGAIGHVSKHGHSGFHAIAQGWQLRAYWTQLEAMALNGTVRVVHSPLLDANMANVILSEEGSSGRTFSKSDSEDHGDGEQKIDGVMAVLSTLAMLETRRDQVVSVGAMIG